MKKLLQTVSFFGASIYAGASYAIGSLGQNLMGVAANISSLVSGICLVIGLSLLAGAVIQYRQHRRNRLMTPISKPIFMLILGLVLVCVPLLERFAPGGEILSQQQLY